MKTTPNRWFSFDKFKEQNVNLFGYTFPFILLRAPVPKKRDKLIAYERIENAAELENTKLNSTPIVFYVDTETKSEFREDLCCLLNRKDIKTEQLFFIIDPKMNIPKTARVISDLGVNNPQLIETCEDDIIKSFVWDYPITEFVRTAIKQLRYTKENISKDLDFQLGKSERLNADTYKKIQELDEHLTKFSELDDFYKQNNYEKSEIFSDILDNFKSSIMSWNDRKTKVSGEEEIENVADELVDFVQNEVQTFVSSINEASNNESEDKFNILTQKYVEVGVDVDYRPTDINLDITDEVNIPEIKSELMQLTEEKEEINIFGFFLGQNNDGEPAMVKFCWLEQWRERSIEIIQPNLEKYIDHCVSNLSSYYKKVADAYCNHISELVESLNKEKGKVQSKLSADAKKIQKDSDWLSKFKSNLSLIEEK